MRINSENELSEVEINLTDVGNARRLILAYGNDLLWCQKWNKWLVWDDKRWVIDDTLQVHRRGIDTIRTMYHEAAQENDEKKRKALVTHALKCESNYKIKAMIDEAKSEVAIDPDQFDKNPWFLNVENGILNLQTGDLFPHRREQYITKLAPVKYDPLAECPFWAKHLRRIMDGNQNLMDFLQSAYGYSLTGNTDERTAFIEFGTGANGKTTTNEVVKQILGDYAVRTPTETLLAKRDGSIPNDVAKLKGSRFVFSSEADEGKRLGESILKDITGGDTISARFMRGEWFEFQPTFKIWLATNHKPIIRGTDNAIWSRIRLIPFNVSIPEEERIPRREMMAKFQEEFPGVLAWMVRGCLAWYKHGLEVPEEVKQATADYRSEMDILGDFIANRCETSLVKTVTAKDLYEEYRRWTESNGEKAISQKAFSMRMAERGFEKKKVHGNKYVWQEIGLIED